MTRSHYNLLSKALHSRHMTGVHSWLTSSSFGDHLIDLAEHICSYSLRDGAVKEEEVEKGWQILTQALTFCEDAGIYLAFEMVPSLFVRHYIFCAPLPC